MKQLRTTSRRINGSPAADYLASAAHDTVDRIAGAAKRRERELRNTATRATKQAHKVKKEATARADASLRDFASYTKKHALLRTGIVFVTGAVLATLLRR